MRSLQLALNQGWDAVSMRDDVPVPWDEAVRLDLRWWTDLTNLEAGRSLRRAVPEICLFTDASRTGWGASLGPEVTSGLWSMVDLDLHINVLELRAIRLGLAAFTKRLHGCTVGLYADNTTALSYLAHAGGTRSRMLNSEAQAILSWAETNSVTLVPRFVRGSDNLLADCLSRPDRVFSTEWTLHKEICTALWKLWGAPLVDLFATRLNFCLAAFVSPVPDAMAVATDAFLFPWDGLEVYAFPPFALVRPVLNRLFQSKGTIMTLIAPFWPQKEWFPDLLRAIVEVLRRLLSRWDLLRQPHVRRFHAAPHELHLVAWRLSGDTFATKVTQRTLPTSWQTLEDLPLL